MLSRFAPNDIVQLRQLFIKYDSLSCKHILQTAESLSCRFKVAEHFLFLGINTENWYSKTCTRCPNNFKKFELGVSILDFLQGLCLVKGSFLKLLSFTILRAI